MGRVTIAATTTAPLLCRVGRGVVAVRDASTAPGPRGPSSGLRCVTCTAVAARESNLQVEENSAAVFTLEAGKIVRMGHYAAHAQALEAAGLSE